ncbi:MAG TPA: hypothetical protein P5560_09310 [Thermotogota bacterium]|nr:hypothetical protein [Thermotogota bacterium]HRW93130.1 hypothetical protein [Thermotogota bacterium]
MKKTLLLLLVVVFLSGWVMAQQWPSMVGTWMGTSIGHGYFDRTSPTQPTYRENSQVGRIVFVVTEQNGRVFWGEKTLYTPDGELMVREAFSAAFKSNGTDFYFLEHIDGFGFGEVLSETHMEIIYGHNYADDPLILVYDFHLLEE